MLFCKANTPARKRYERDAMRFLAAYVVVVFCSAWFVKHDGAEPFYRYFWSVLPAIPIVSLVWRMGRYLQEEKDEYQRLIRMQSLLLGTGAMIAVLVVSDFLRTYAHARDLPPFTLFVTFGLGNATGEVLNWFRNRVRDDA